MARFFIKVLFLIFSIHIAIAVSTIAASTDGEADLLKNWVIERTQYSAALENHTAVELTNHFGDIRVRTSNDDVISIFAITQHHIEDDVNSQIQIESVENRLKITVLYPAQLENQDTDRSNDVNINKRRVDISLLIPENIRLSMDTIDGRAESKGHKGPIHAKTISGQVILVTKGPVNASSVEGPITITFKNDTWSKPSSIVSSTGRIHVLFIENLNINVEINTSGTITTDYSVEIRNNVPASAKKKATARIGKASHQLTIKSTLGPVILSRIFDMIKPD